MRVGHIILIACCAALAVSANEEAIQISEIMYHPPVPGEELEFVELVNSSADWVDLTNWRFVSGIRFTFPAGSFLAPGERVVVCRNVEALIALVPIANAVGNFTGALANDGDTIELVDAAGVLALRMHYNDVGDWPEEPDGLGASLERTHFSHDPDWGASFAASHIFMGTPGAENSCAGQGPSARYTPPIPCLLNEVIVTTDATTVELYNPSANAVSLNGYRVVPDGNLAQSTDLTGRTIGAGQYIIVSADTSTIVGDVVRFFLIGAASRALVDTIEVGPLAPGANYARVPNGDGRVWLLTTATPSGPNGAPSQAQVVISEIFYHPLSEDSQEEWLELCNISGRPVDLSDWRITQGVDYTIVAGTVLGAGEALCLAANPSMFQARHGVAALGPFAGTLRNSGEVVRLRDAKDNLVDEVRYADDGPWPVEADGQIYDANGNPIAGGGKSLVRRHAGLPGSAPGAWKASAAVGGEPGTTVFQSAATTNPVVYAVMHAPGTPTPSQGITVTGLVAGANTISGVSVFWKHDAEASYHEVAAVLGQTEPCRGQRFQAMVPAAGANGVLVFYVTARQTGGLTARFPASGEALIPVDGSGDAVDAVTFRMVMRGADWTELTTRDVDSDVPLPCTIVYRGIPYYQAETRYRGNSARTCSVPAVCQRSFRIDCGDHHDFPLAKTTILNGQRPEDQRLGMDYFARCGLVTPLSRLVVFVRPDARFSGYHQVEWIDDEFIERAFPKGEEDGNLYRGDGDATLTYIGDDPDSYRNDYVKKTNEWQDDFSDLIELCRVLSDPVEFEQRVDDVADWAQWARWYGAHAFLNNEENSLANDHGDDYFIYRNPRTGKFVLLPWDLDTLMRTPTERLFRPTLPSVRRLLTWAPAARVYAATLVESLASHARPDVMEARNEPTRTFGNAVELDRVLSGVRERAAFLPALLPRTIAAHTFIGATLVPWNSTWRYFKSDGRDPSTGIAWTQIAFNDSLWPLGQGGFGYGDNDDQTVLDDMYDNYAVVCVRRSFDVPAPDTIATLTLRVHIDDGFAAYINGREVGRDNAGNEGEVLNHDSRADDALEPRTVELSIASPQSVLVRGVNVLAIIGLNESRTSSDFSLDAELVSTGGNTSLGADDRILTDAAEITLLGSAIPEKTVQVHVNGHEATYTTTSFTWSTTITPSQGRNTYRVDLIDETGSASASEDIVVWRKPITYTRGTLAASQHWTENAGPYALDGDLDVPVGTTLSIDPGAVVFMNDLTHIVVHGELRIDGTRDAPARILRAREGAVFGGVRIESTGACALRNTILIGGGNGAPLFDVRGGTLGFYGSRAERTQTVAVSAQGGAVTVSDAVFDGVHGGIQCQGTALTLLGSRIENVTSDYALAITGGSATVTHSTFSRGTRGLLLQGEATLIGVTCRDFDATGIRIDAAGIQGRTLFLEGNGTGLAIAAGRTGTFDHVTAVGCGAAFALESGTTLRVSDGIVWQNQRMLDMQGTSSRQFDHCDTQDLVAGTANFSEDPRFEGGAVPYRIMAGSPCAGTGTAGSDRGAFPAGLAAPTLTAVTPSSGPAEGGTRVTITGTGFTPDTRILVDSVPAGDVVFVDAHRLTCVMPPRTLGVTAAVEALTQLGKTSSPAAYTYGARVYLKGDVNGSDVIDISDAISLLSYLYAAGKPPVCAQAADANNDTRLDIGDAIFILSYLFAKGTAPFPPHVSC